MGAGNDLGGLEGIPAGVFRKKRKKRFARSLRRDKASSSRAERSSWSFSKRATKSDLVLGGVKLREDIAAGTSEGSIWGKVISGKLAKAGEPLWEPCADAGGDALEAASKGSSSVSASRARRLAAAKRIAVAAWMSAGGGGWAAHMFKNVRRRTCSSSSAKAGCIFTAAARRVENRDAGEKASWGPGEGPGGGPP